MQLYVGDGRKPFKVGHLFMLQGKDHVEVPSAVPGDIAPWPRWTSCTSTPCCTTPPRTTTSTFAAALPTPVHGLAIAPKRHGDEQRCGRCWASWSTKTPA
jgi:elongation factor G